jgi:hypothetical protein
MLCIPEHLALQLKLEQQSVREVTVADGRSMTVPYVGPISVGSLTQRSLRSTQHSHQRSIPPVLRLV